MLYLYQSNRLETLANIAATLHQSVPLSDPMAAEQIIIQSQGMRRYLSTHLAQQLGVAANLKYNLPASLTWQLMRELLPNIPAMSPFSPDVMRWRLLSLFHSEAFQTASAYQHARAALHSYLTNGDNAAYQIAGQLADIFDQYLVYRPEWINTWQANQLLGLGDDEAWQAELWRFLDNGSYTAPHRVAMWQQLLQALNANSLPERYFVFGISTMAPMYLQLLQAMAQYCDVHIFTLNPAEMHWGNVIEAAQILKNPADETTEASGHPLLASLGKQGRDFFDSLADTPNSQEYQYFSSSIEENNTPTLLHRLQHDILTLQNPDLADYTPTQWDDSIQIHSTHSPLRELQILKDQLLQTLAEHPNWQPHDIAVLTPNIEPYSPFIHAVFGQNNHHSQALPYSISDVKLSRHQPLLHALEQTLTLLESRFETNHFLSLLDSDILLNRFELTREDLPLLHDTISQLNIHWGADETMRHQHGARDNLFTWQQGLERLTLGWLLPENPQAPLWHNLSAWHSDPNQLTVFSQFAALIRSLDHIRQQWQQEATIAEWMERIRQLIDTLFSPSTEDQHARQQLEQTLAKWQQQAELARFNETLPQNIIIQHLKSFLSSESQAGFLRGGITFCSMVPMRSLPFKMICLLGLNDGDFPRNTKAASFDLIAQHPQKGDRARRDDDRYLFLEALISTREKLYLSYIGHNQSKNDELAPSPLLNELIDTLASMTQHSSEEVQTKYIQQHPLQAFSPRYFTINSQLVSTRQDYARALSQPAPAPAPFYQQPLSEEAASTQINHTSFLTFWRNPARAWLKQQLQWQSPYLDEAWQASEPFEPTNSELINAEYTAARRQQQDFTTTAERLQAESQLPTGELGALWQNSFQITAKMLDETLCRSPKRPPVAYTLNFSDGLTLSGSLNHLYEHGQLFFINKKLDNPNKISFLLQHLIFNATKPSETSHSETHILGNGEQISYPAIATEEAHQLLRKWLLFYQIGQRQPLPFFPRLSLAVAEKLITTPSRSSKNLSTEAIAQQQLENAQQTARDEWHGNKRSTGVKDYTEPKLIYGRDETPPIESELFWNIVQQALVPLLQMLSAQEEAI